MVDEPENLTWRLLQELRQDIGQLRDDVSQLRAETRASLKDLTQRVNGVSVMVSMVAGMAHDHEERIEKLESR